MYIYIFVYVYTPCNLDRYRPRKSVKSFETQLSNLDLGGRGFQKLVSGPQASYKKWSTSTTKVQVCTHILDFKVLGEISGQRRNLTFRAQGIYILYTCTVINKCDILKCLHIYIHTYVYKYIYIYKRIYICASTVIYMSCEVY